MPIHLDVLFGLAYDESYKPPEARLAAKAVSKQHKRVVQK
jgi:hypothetical protein